MLPKDHLIIAIDFDGTIVEDAYPSVGKPMIFALETIKKLQADGHRLILWTYRNGEKLQEAVDFCKSKGIEFYAVNKNYPEEEFDGKVGGFLGWTEIYKIIFNYEPNVPKDRGFLSWFR